MIMSMKTFSIVCLTLFSLLATPVFAQFDASSFSTPELSIDLQPTFPGPGEEVTATLNDYAGGAYGSNVTWVLNGRELPNYHNQRSITFVAGNSGDEQILKALLDRPIGGQLVLSTTIKPLYLDIVVEPQTRVPNFYTGRSLPSIGSTVNVTALVSDQNGIRNDDFVYTWKINQDVIEGGPIRGRNQTSFVVPLGNRSTLTVEVTNINGTTIAKRSVFLAAVQPELLFYEVSSLFGVSHKPITNNLPLIGNSVVVRAEPYYLDSRVYNDPDIHEWTINNTTGPNSGKNPYEVTLQRTSANGTSILQFHVRDISQLLQGAEGSVQIKF